MKPQGAAFLEKAQALLREAETMLKVDLNDAAWRTAYLAGFLRDTCAHVQDALGRAQRVRAPCEDARVDRELRGFLGYAHQLKVIADYESGPGSKVSASAARAALEAARRFVECVTSLIPANGPTPPARP